MFSLALPQFQSGQDIIWYLIVLIVLLNKFQIPIGWQNGMFLQDNCHLGQTLEEIFFIPLWLRQHLILSTSLLTLRWAFVASPMSPSLDNRHVGRTQVGDSSYSLEATHRVDTLWPWSHWIYTSLSSFPPVPWLIQSDHALNGRSKEISCCSSKDIWIPLPRIPFSLFFEERPVSFARGLLIPFHFALLRATYPTDSSTFFVWWTWSYWLCHWFLRSAFIDALERTYWSSLCGLAVLHYIGLKNIWVDSEVGFLHALFSLVRLTRFHQDLGWLSCLHSPTFRHMYTSWSVFHRILRPVLFVALWYLISSVLPSLWSIAPLVTGISNPMASLRRSSFFSCTIDDATPEWISRLWRTLQRRINLFSNLFD